MQGNVRTCSWNYVTSMTLLPAGQAVTLLMKDSKSEILGSLQITMDSLTMNCIPKNKNWMYSYRIQSEAFRRCPGMGLCSGGFCGRIKMSDEVPELEQCQRYPSNRFCLESCSTWWRGCAIPPVAAPYVKACFFYGYYAKPIKETEGGTARTSVSPLLVPNMEHHIKADIRG